MRIVAFGLSVVILSVCLGLPVEKAKTVTANPGQSDERGPVSADIDDSDLFFQNALRTKGAERSIQPSWKKPLSVMASARF